MDLTRGIAVLGEHKTKGKTGKPRIIALTPGRAVGAGFDVASDANARAMQELSITNRELAIVMKQSLALQRETLTKDIPFVWSK